MKFTVAVLALLTVSLSAAQVSASVVDSSGSTSGYQAQHRHHHHHHHRRHHKMDEGRGAVTLESSAIV
jgi:hypothetical protein